MEWTNKNAVIYAQVNTDRQMKHWNWIKSQQTLCWMYAKSKWINVVESFQDWWKSWRDGLNQMIEYIKFRNKSDKVIDYLIIEDIDRLCWSMKEWFEIQNVFERECNVEIISLNQNFGNEPEARMMIQIALTIKFEYHGMNK